MSRTKKSNTRKLADAATRKALRARIMRVLLKAGYNTEPGYVPILSGETSRRVAALVRELLDT